MGRRRFGAIRRLPSRRWRASYVATDGRRRSAPRTFETKTDAARWLAKVELQLAEGVDPYRAVASRTQFGAYARSWLKQNPNIGPRWRETCERNMRLHLASLETSELRAITPAVVRDWYRSRLDAGAGRTSLAQAYRFLRAVLNTAVRDELIDRNPCQIPKAGSPRAERRPVATPSQIQALVDAIDPQYRAAVLLAAWGGLRRGEILGLYREDVDLDAGTVTVRRTFTELPTSKKRFDSPPKTDAGYRTIAIPPHVLPHLSQHLEQHAGPTRLFVAPNGQPMRGDALYHAFVKARTHVGMDGFRFHDLRHTGQTLAAATGATLADLMKRLGHSSPAAAMRYLHTVNGRDHAIAQALSDLAQQGDAAALPPNSRRQ